MRSTKTICCSQERWTLGWDTPPCCCSCPHVVYSVNYQVAQPGGKASHLEHYVKTSNFWKLILYNLHPPQTCLQQCRCKQMSCTQKHCCSQEPWTLGWDTPPYCCYCPNVVYSVNYQVAQPGGEASHLELYVGTSNFFKSSSYNLHPPQTLLQQCW